MNNIKKKNEKEIIESQEDVSKRKQEEIKRLERRIVELNREIVKLCKIIALLESSDGLEFSKTIQPALVTAQDVEKLLTELGISYGLIGRQYLKAAIIYVLERKQKVKMCEDVYPTVARKFKTSKRAVERGIRYAITNAIKQDTFKLREIFSTAVLETGRLKNSEFIYGIIYFMYRDR